MKKSELLKIIREEVEVVLTNAEAQEFFDLDMSKLLDEMMSEAWKGDPEIKQTGEWADKTTEELCARKKTLMKQKSRTELEQKEVREINFAIRSKQKGPKFGKVGC
jgi:hypothetical protein